MISLSNLLPGQSGRLNAVLPGCPLRERLLDMGLVPGTTVTVLYRAPLKGPLMIALRGYHLTLRFDAAEAILINA